MLSGGFLSTWSGEVSELSIKNRGREIQRTNSHFQLLLASGLMRDLTAERDNFHHQAEALGGVLYHLTWHPLSPKPRTKLQLRRGKNDHCLPFLHFQGTNSNGWRSLLACSDHQISKMNEFGKAYITKVTKKLNVDSTTFCQLPTLMVYNKLPSGLR